MDVHCSTCGAAWDIFHLCHEAIFDIGLSVEEAQAWRFLPRDEKLSDRYRKEFRIIGGWTFGQSVINVIRCPCCPRNIQPNPERVQMKAALEELMGDDEAALAAAFEEHGL